MLPTKLTGEEREGSSGTRVQRDYLTRTGIHIVSPPDDENRPIHGDFGPGGLRIVPAKR